MRSVIRYLYTGWLPNFGTDEARRRGLLEMGREVITLSYQPFFQYRFSKFTSFQHKLGFGPGIWAYNRRLVDLARKTCPQVVWIDKGHLVTRSTLQTIKREIGALLVCYNTDDIAFNHGWRLHRQGLQEYDIYFTTNVLHAEDLRSLGTQRVVLTHMGYDRDLFKPPYPLRDEEMRILGAAVGFIGHWESATEKLMLELLDLGLPLRIRHVSWSRAKNKKRLSPISEVVFLPPTQYVKALAATQVNLGINSTQNRNLCSGRTFEISAAGGFLLAQRTNEHQGFYDEGREAEFFDSALELAEKAYYYLAHETSRRRVAEAGHKRCVTSGYSWQERMVSLVKIVEQACGQDKSALGVRIHERRF